MFNPSLLKPLHRGTFRSRAMDAKKLSRFEKSDFICRVASQKTNRKWIKLEIVKECSRDQTVFPSKWKIKEIILT